MQITELFKVTNSILNIVLPEDYKKLTIDGTFKKLFDLYNFYFLDEAIIDIYKIPCALGATIIFRKNNLIPQENNIMLLNRDDDLYYLETLTNNIYYINGVNNIIDTKSDLLTWISDNFNLLRR